MTRDIVSNRRNVLKGIGSLGVGAGIAGCTGQSGLGGDDNGSGGAEEYFGVSGPFAENIRGLTWDGWDVPNVTGVFKQRTGLTVSTEYVGSDLKAFNRFQGGADFEFSSLDNIWVQRMGEAGIAESIPEDEFSETLSNIPELLRDHPTMFYDGDRYGIPPRWGVQGLIYNSDHVSEQQAQNRATLWDSEFQDRVEIFNLPLWSGPAVAMYLIETGDISVSEVNAETVYNTVTNHRDKIRQAMVDLHRNARLFPNSTSEAHRPLIDESVWLFNGYLLDFAQLKQVEQSLGTDKFQFVPNPGVGGIMWIEGLAINKVDNDEERNTTKAFMNWTLSPEGQANLAWTELRKSPPCNQAARDFMSDRQIEILHMDRMNEIADNSIDYIPSNEDQWVNVWEEAKQAA